ncbi:acid protease, partial [Melanomma pulvis-pyrius CBS 109.77]
PISFSPSQEWDGNDGHWSSFIMRVGKPEQNFRVFPASAMGETLVPIIDGCGPKDPPNCGDLRGVYPFQDKVSGGLQVNVSTTWSEIGIYYLDVRPEVNFTGKGLYGLENLGLMVQNSGGPTLEKQVVAGVKTKTIYTGLFGLSPKASNFSEFNNPQPSYMTTLKNSKTIPSLSFGYTAGAYYKSPKVLGSLTLGGYDSSRYESNNVTFPFDTNDDRPISLNIQNIIAKDTLIGVQSLMSDVTYTRIDFTVPHLWLPKSVCDRFATAFGLTYDDATDLYLVNDTIHYKLLHKNPSVTIGLGSSYNPTQRVNVVLPYSAFDLQARYPIYNNETNYFPIRRAYNESQYTLGRTFLQEAYVTVDYERSNFSVYQALFPPTNVKQQLVSIASTDVAAVGGLSPTQTPHGGHLSHRAMAGIAIGSIAVLLVCVFVALTFLCCRRK